MSDPHSSVYGKYLFGAAVCLAMVFLGCAAPTDTLPGTVVSPPAAEGAMAPYLTAAAEGVLLSWLEPGMDGRMVLKTSRFARGGWSAVSTIVEGETFFANWADTPVVVELGEGSLLSHWLEKLGDATYAYGASLARSADLGASWDRLGLLHDDDSPTEHGFVSYVPLGNGQAQAFWLDGRETAAGGAMQLRTAAVDGTGARPSQLLDARVCDCCPTDAALTADGPIVVYRDRGETELRDPWIVRAVPGGWSAPEPIAEDGWEIHGCPVNGPAVAARGRLVAVAWYTAAAGSERVQITFSTDGGETFGAPISIDGDRPLGRVDIVLESAGEAVVSWLARHGDGAEIRLRRVASDGAVGAPLSLARTAASRASGIPRLAPAGEGLLAAWVDPGEPSRLAARYLPPDSLPGL